MAEPPHPLHLVTGGAGFLGRHLVAALAARGARVRVLDQVPWPWDPAGAASGDTHPDAHPDAHPVAQADALARAQATAHPIDVIQGSVTDRALVDQAMAGVTRVFHLAAYAHLWHRDRSVFERINHGGTRTVLTAARAAGVQRFVQCSSESVLTGPARGATVTETTAVAPTRLAGPYSRSKQRADAAVLEAAEAGLSACIVHPTVPIGPGDTNLTPPTTMLLGFLTGRWPAYYNAWLDLVDVRDVASALAAAGERGTPGARYLAAGTGITLADLLAELEALSGRAMPRHRIPGALALSVAVLQQQLADHVTHRPPSASIEGVRLALRSPRFDARATRAALGLSVRPMRAALHAAVADLAARGLIDADAATDTPRHAGPRR